MANRNVKEKVQESGTHGEKKRSKGSVIAFVICVLIALAIWIYAKNTEIKNENAQAPALASVQQTTADDGVCFEG